MLPLDLVVDRRFGDFFNGPLATPRTPFAPISVRRRLELVILCNEIAEVREGYGRMRIRAVDRVHCTASLGGGTAGTGSPD